MSPERKAEIVQVLENSREDFNTAVAGLAESQASINPQAGRWSVLECVEHVTVVEERFLGRIENSERLDAPPVNKQREAELTSRVTNRAERAQAPEFVQPTGRYATLTDALQEFNAVRTRTIRFAEQQGADLYQLSTTHQRFGDLNGAELLILIAGHSRRHAEQIREVRTALANRG